MRTGLPAWYARIVGGFLLLQGVVTGSMLLVDPLDRAFPAILNTTRMVPQHSALQLQPFDHGFHLVAGVPGLVAAGLARPGRTRLVNAPGR